MTNSMKVKLNKELFIIALIMVFLPDFAYSKLLGPDSYHECELEAYKKADNQEKLAFLLHACELEFGKPNQYPPDAFIEDSCTFYWNGYRYIPGSKTKKDGYRGLKFTHPNGMNLTFWMPVTMLNYLGVSDSSGRLTLSESKKLKSHFDQHYSSVSLTCQAIRKENNQ